MRLKHILDDTGRHKLVVVGQEHEHLDIVLCLHF
jgi:hypothetical protein